MGQYQWGKIDRTFREDILHIRPLASRQKFALRYAIGVVLVVLSAVLINDLSATNNCGESETPFFRPVLFKPRSTVNWTVNLKKTAQTPGSLHLTASHSLHDAGGTFEIRHLVDEEVKDTHLIDPEKSTWSFNYSTTPSWAPLTYRSTLRGEGLFCSREIRTVGVAKEIRDGKLYVNGEPFLIKAVVPSFSSAGTALPTATGYRQIKELGANAVRIYHPPTTEMDEAASREELLVIDQPSSSTWTNIDIDSDWDRALLKRRIDRLFEERRAFPYTLFHLAGNELEISLHGRAIRQVFDFLKELPRTNANDLLSYSTYYTYLNYPVSVLGINMLDTGETYWNKGLGLASRFEMPVYGSEFGGFAAFFERTPALLRAYRLRRYWEKLLEHKFLGAVVFESHDNWAQPVPSGYNDPLSPEQPDDQRGIWDRLNQPKLEKQVIEQLYSDIQIFVRDNELAKDASHMSVALKNIRPYALRDLKLIDDKNNLVFSSAYIGAGEEIEKSIQIPEKQNSHLRAYYSTHSGLKGVSSIRLAAPIRGERPVVLNHSFLSTAENEREISGWMLESGELYVLGANNWKRIQIGDKFYEISLDSNHFPLPSPMLSLTSEVSPDGGNTWLPFHTKDCNIGDCLLRFEVPSVRDKSEALLLLGGLGSDHFTIRRGANGKPLEMESHYYREIALPLESLPEQGKGNIFYVEIKRNRTTYVSAADNPYGEAITIDLEPPQLFQPTRISIERDE